MSSDLGALMGDKRLGNRRSPIPFSLASTSIGELHRWSPTSPCPLGARTAHDDSKCSYNSIIPNAFRSSFYNSELTLHSQNCKDTAILPPHALHWQYGHESFDNPPVDPNCQWYAKTANNSDYVRPSDLELVPFTSSDAEIDISPIPSPSTFQQDDGFSQLIPPTTSAQHHVTHVDQFAGSSSAVRGNTYAISTFGTGGRLAGQKRIELIKVWLKNHAASPYPSEEDIADLVAETGLTAQQVRACLNNQRFRSKASAAEIPLASTPNPKLGYWLENQNASHHYQHSLASVPDNSSILHATEDLTCDPWGSWTPSLSSLIPHDQNPESGFDGAGEDLQNTPLSTNSSSAGIASPISKAKRKGKRVYPSRYNAGVPPTINSSTSDDSGGSPQAQEPYHCTLCPKSFKTAYGWKRHETGVHGFHVQEWICMLNGTLIRDNLCVFCGDEVTSMDHFEQHNIAVCFRKDQAARTFARKDLLKQHVQQKHVVHVDDKTKRAFVVPDGWVQDVDASRSDPASLWCGFCLKFLNSTATRMEHVAAHFRGGGLDMASDWVPCGSM